MRVNFTRRFAGLCCFAVAALSCSSLLSVAAVVPSTSPRRKTVLILVNRHTQAPVRFVGGLSLLIRAFEDVYGNLEGRLMEALARLFVQNVRIYVYPMMVADLREWLKSAFVTGWESSGTNGWVSVSQLHRAPPLGHLFAYLLASNFLVLMQVPVEA